MVSKASSFTMAEMEAAAAAEVAQLQALPHSYRDAIKATLRARTKTVIDMIGLSFTTFSKLVQLPKGRVMLVLLNQWNPNPVFATRIYARFAQFLYAFDARVVSTVVHALDPELNRSFHGLQDTPSEADLAAMNSTEKAKALGQCLGNKKNAPILDKLARNLLTHFQLQGADLTLSTVKSYLNLSMPLLSRAYLDRQTVEMLNKKEEPAEGWLSTEYADSNGKIFEFEEDEESGDDIGAIPSDDELEEDVGPPTSAKRASSNGAPAAASSSSSSSTKQRHSSSSVVKMEVDHSSMDEDEDENDGDWVAEAAAIRATALKQRSEYSNSGNPAPSSSSSSSNNNFSSAGVKRPRSMAAASAPRLASAASSSSPFSQSAAASSRSRDSGHQGPGQSQYTPPIFLKATMGAVLVRMIQVLERDGFSRRQVAVQIGISQSKISRLLHGRSPFRTPEEEFHLRHWVYRQEKQWIAGIENVLKRATKDNQKLDFALLPEHLRAVDPQTLVEYLDYTLPLDKRKAVDKAVALVLGYKNADWVRQADVETEEMRLIREADELAAREALEGDSPSAIATDTNEANHEHGLAQQRVRLQRGFDPKNAKSGSEMKQQQRRQQRDDETEMSDHHDESDSDRSMSEEDERKEANDNESHEEEEAQPRKKAKRTHSSLFDNHNDSPSSGDLESEHPSGPTCGLDAWNEVNYASARIRVQQLMAITNVSQTVFAKLLEISSGTVSMILRGIFRFSSLGRYLGKLRVWGRATDQLLVMKALSILGADHSTRRDPISNPNQYPEAHLMREERKDSEGREGAEEEDSIAKNMQAGEGASQALEELAVLLSDVDIPMENDEAAMISSASEVLPVSLWSWLNFRCDFHERSRLDEIMLTWVERWSNQGQDDMDSDAGVTLDYQQTESLDRFQEFLTENCQGCNHPQAVKVH